MIRLASAFRLLPATAAVLLLLAGCSAKIPGVYRIDIQQGNVVEQEMLDRLEPGMEKRKVRFILGTPLLVDTFNQDRWDYLYSISEGGDTRQQRSVSIFFEDERLSRIEGDVRPRSAERKPSGPKEILVVLPAERRQEGFFEALTPDFLRKRARPALASLEPAEEVVESASEAVDSPEADPQESLASPEFQEPSESTDADSESESAAAVASAASPQTGITGVTGAAEDNDPGFLKRLFKGFGREGEGAAETSAATTSTGFGRDADRVDTLGGSNRDESDPGPNPDSALALDSDEPVDPVDDSTLATVPTPDKGDTEAEKGFFKKLVKKFRDLRASDEPAESDALPTPPSAPTDELEQ